MSAPWPLEAERGGRRPLSTPVRRQYLEIKARHPDAILFFRLGDFYETFDDDAALVSRELGVVLTSKPLGRGLRVPLAGVPVASVEGHLATLVAKGHRVAICEQLDDEDGSDQGDPEQLWGDQGQIDRNALDPSGPDQERPEPGPHEQGQPEPASGAFAASSPAGSPAKSSAKGLVRRGVVRVVSPGTALEPVLLEGGRNNYCAALVSLPGLALPGLAPPQRGSPARAVAGPAATREAARRAAPIPPAQQEARWGLAAADLSTGEFRCCEFSGPGAAARCAAELELLAPKELLRPSDLSGEAGAGAATDPPVIARALAELAPAPSPRPPAQFAPAAAAARLREHYRLAAVEGLGLGERPAALAAAGALLRYLQESQAGALAQLARPRLYEPGARMRLDAPTLLALALVDDLFDAPTAPPPGRGSGDSRRRPPATLLAVLDRTRSAAGRRLLRARLARPLLQLAPIEARLDRLQLLRERPLLRGRLMELLRGVPDLERLLARAAAGLAQPPEVARLGAGLAAAASLSQTLSEALGEPPGALAAGALAAAGPVDPSGDAAGADGPQGSGRSGGSPQGAGPPSQGRGPREPGGEPGWSGPAPLPPARVAELGRLLAQELRPAAVAQAAIAACLEERPAAAFGEGGFEQGHVLRPGADPQCDAARERLRAARAAIAALEAQERRRSGIANLKVGYHRTFGYYLEVTKSGLARVPADYERRQTLAGGERFVTPALRALETQALEARETLVARERELFARLRRQLGAQAQAVRALARGVARLDVDCALAQVAAERGYVRPRLDHSGALVIREGRHPIVEAASDLGAGALGAGGLSGGAPGSGGPFVPNDIELQAGRGPGPPQLLLLTGPNMGGKSTYLRQTALIVLMAQCGSFVPAAEARIGLVDRVFARVGAHDRLAAGQSTFMVEMLESAAILAAASERSLLVLDEIGRGTSTYDGLAVARALLEYLVEGPVAGAAAGAAPSGGGSGTGGPRTLFATHFHELTALAGLQPRVANAHVAVHEGAVQEGAVHEGARPAGPVAPGAGEEGLAEVPVPDAAQLRLLYKVRPGAADRSYGLQVAAMAGLPPSLLDRAAALLRELELPNARTGAEAGPLAGPLAGPPAGQPGPPAFLRRPGPLDPQAAAPSSPSLAPVGEPSAPAGAQLAAELVAELVAELAQLDVDAITPLEAIAALYALRDRALRDRAMRDRAAPDRVSPGRALQEGAAAGAASSAPGARG